MAPEYLMKNHSLRCLMVSPLRVLEEVFEDNVLMKFSEGKNGIITGENDILKGSFTVFFGSSRCNFLQERV